MATTPVGPPEKIDYSQEPKKALIDNNNLSTSSNLSINDSPQGDRIVEESYSDGIQSGEQVERQRYFNPLLTISNPAIAEIPYSSTSGAGTLSADDKISPSENPSSAGRNVLLTDQNVSIYGEITKISGRKAEEERNNIPKILNKEVTDKLADGDDGNKNIINTDAAFIKEYGCDSRGNIRNIRRFQRWLRRNKYDVYGFYLDIASRNNFFTKEGAIDIAAVNQYLMGIFSAQNKNGRLVGYCKELVELHKQYFPQSNLTTELYASLDEIRLYNSHIAALNKKELYLRYDVEKHNLNNHIGSGADVAHGVSKRLAELAEKKKEHRKTLEQHQLALHDEKVAREKSVTQEQYAYRQNIIKEENLKDDPIPNRPINSKDTELG